MTRPLLTFVLLCATGCHEQISDAPNEGPDPDFGLPAPAHFPTSRDIEGACSEAVRTAIRDAPGIVHPTYYDYPVRGPQCRWTEERPIAAECRFEQSTVAIEFPTDEQRAEAMRSMKARDWRPFRATLVRVPSRWVAPAGCHPSSP